MRLYSPILLRVLISPEDEAYLNCEHYLDEENNESNCEHFIIIRLN